MSLPSLSSICLTQQSSIPEVPKQPEATTKLPVTKLILQPSVPFALNETSWKKLKEDVKKGPCKRLEILAKILSYPGEHPFFEKEPKLAAKLSIMLIKQWNKGNISTELRLKVQAQCYKYNIYKKAALPEKVHLKCIDGTVSFNKVMILTNDSAYRTYLNSHKMEKGQDITISEGMHSSMHKAAMDIIKEYTYTTILKPLDPDGGITSIETAVELLLWFKCKTIQSSYQKEIHTCLDKCVIPDEETLEKILALLKRIPPLESKAKPLQLRAVERFIGQRLNLMSLANNFYSLSVDQLSSLLDSTRKQPFPNQKHVVENTLLQYIRGITIPSESNLDLITMLPFYPKELFKNIFTVDFLTKRPESQMTLACEALLEAIPHLISIRFTLPEPIAEEPLQGGGKNYTYQGAPLTEILKILKAGRKLEQIRITNQNNVQPEKDTTIIRGNAELIHTMQSAPPLVVLSHFRILIDKNDRWFKEECSGELRGALEKLSNARALSNYIPEKSLHTTPDALSIYLRRKTIAPLNFPSSSPEETIIPLDQEAL